MVIYLSQETVEFVNNRHYPEKSRCSC